MTLDPRRVIHIPETGSIVIVPTEAELIDTLVSKRAHAKRSLVQLYHAFGLDGALTSELARSVQEAKLRELFARYTKRRMSNTRHVPAERQKKAVKPRRVRPMVTPGSTMAKRADEVRALMRDRNFTQAEAARKLKLSQPYISQLLKRSA